MARHLQSVGGAGAAAEHVRVVLPQKSAQRGADVRHARYHPRLCVPRSLLQHALQRVTCKRSGTSAYVVVVFHSGSEPYNSTLDTGRWQLPAYFPLTGRRASDSIPSRVEGQGEAYTFDSLAEGE